MALMNLIRVPRLPTEPTAQAVGRHLSGIPYSMYMYFWPAEALLLRGLSLTCPSSQGTGRETNTRNNQEQSSSEAESEQLGSSESQMQVFPRIPLVSNSEL